MPNCKSVMTEMPMCCLAEDTIEKAVNIMKLADVGSVPVIDDHETKILVGIVTDRDVAVKSMAPAAAAVTRVKEIMTLNPVTCGPDEDVGNAVRVMGTHQVRRIPIVSLGGRLVGIISQGDIATKINGEQVAGAVVKEISKLI